jgi:multiple sugar transport system permease protein
MYPIFECVRLSFFSVPYIGASRISFVGLGNYIRMVNNPQFLHSLSITIIYTIVTVAGSFFVGLMTALLVNCKFRGRSVARTIMIIPWAVPQVAACLIWAWMFDPQYSVIDFFLLQTGLIKEDVNWLINSSVALFTVSMVTIWKCFPLSTIVLLSALQSIPQNLYEAAKIDGAGSISRFWYVTIPWAKSSIYILLLLVTIWSFRRFAIIYVLTGGGPSRATNTLIISIYNKAFKFFDVGGAETWGVVGFIFSTILTILYFALTAKSKA